MAVNKSFQQASALLRQHNRLREAGFGMLNMLRAMEKDQALRLPFPRYGETFEALRKELE
jgi:hypothetical protein